MTRDQIHSQFAAEFHRGPRALPTSPDQLEAMEERLHTTMPQAYCDLLLKQGPLSTPTLPAMAEEVHEDWPVLAFLDPAQVPDITHAAWAIGLPRNLMTFAVGPRNTYFCFDRCPKGRRRREDDTVWGFNPTLQTPLRLSDSFDAWLQDLVEEVYLDEDRSDHADLEAGMMERELRGETDD